MKYGKVENVTMLTDQSTDATQANSRRPALRGLITLAVGFAIMWWIAALIIRETGSIHVWTDQTDKFTHAASYFLNPYSGMSGFFSPPWAVVFLAPFEWIAIHWATLIQAVIYFCLLGLIAYRYNISSVGWLAAMCSPLALDAILELNIDWIAAIGLVVPAQFSLVFLAVKPQSFPGYVFTLSRRQFVRATLIFLMTLLISFVIWGDWLLPLYNEFATRDLALSASISPWAFIPPPLSIMFGIGLLIFAYRRQDDVLKILSGVFFTPYLPTYTAIIPFLLICIRFPRVGAYLSFSAWLIVIVIFGQIFLS